jgi:superfamily II DNA helicase RecQ
MFNDGCKLTTVACLLFSLKLNSVFSYQLPAMVEEARNADELKLTILICPLIALSKDQFRRCDDLGIVCGQWNSSQDSQDLAKLERRLLAGEIGVLVTTPESLCKEQLATVCKTLGERNIIGRMVIDEAHCVSQWGHDFRPAYQNLGQIRTRLFPKAVVLAMTATASAAVADDILASLMMKKAQIHRADLDRLNLTFEFCYKDIRPPPREVLRVDGSGEHGEEEKVLTPAQHQLIQLIRRAPPGCGIVYCRTRAACDALLDPLLDAGLDAAR